MNIIASFGVRPIQSPSGTGCITSTYSQETSNVGLVSGAGAFGGSFGRSTYTFNASRASGIYGNSDTVTPESLKCSFAIKY